MVVRRALRVAVLQVERRPARANRLLAQVGEAQQHGHDPASCEGACSGAILAALFREEKAACVEALIATSSSRMPVVNVLENRYGRCVRAWKSQQVGRNGVLALARDHRRPSDQRSQRTGLRLDRTSGVMS